jgi:hypothetical protein
MKAATESLLLNSHRKSQIRILKKLDTEEIFRRTRNARRIERRVYRNTQGEDEKCSDKVMRKINKYRRR